MNNPVKTDVAIIGAGPAGSVTGALLRDKGWDVTILEHGHFPRFSIGESLLPQCMESLERAGMLPALEGFHFQNKIGAAFSERERYGELNFADQFSDGWTRTWEVTRADFDDILIKQAEKRGAEVHFGQRVTDVDFDAPGGPLIKAQNEQGERFELSARFVCDASGFGRVLPKLLKLDRPAPFPPRAAMFTHVLDGLNPEQLDRERILVCIHPERAGVWYWLIPFPSGRCSVGVVGDPEYIQPKIEDKEAHLRSMLAEEPRMAKLVSNAQFIEPVRANFNYAASTTRLYGENFALLGNATEFLDPVFSSGVTVALKSAVLAAELADEQLRGQSPDWQVRFEDTLRAGVRVFAAFVNAWYAGRLKHVFFATKPDPRIQAMICSVLAGYVWDVTNPYVAHPERRLKALCDTCMP